MCNDEIFNETYEVLKKYKIKTNYNRSNASGRKKQTHYGNKIGYIGYGCKSENYGLVRQLIKKVGEPRIKDGVNNTRKPEIYEALKKLIHHISPNFDYNTITLNHNFKCIPHVDKYNTSPSLIVGIGKYTGGELVLDDAYFEIHNNPLIFNGGSIKHWVNDFEGDRYSIIYFKSNDN